MSEGEQAGRDVDGPGDLIPTRDVKQRPYADVTRRLTEKELLSPAGLQFLIGEVERLNQEITDLKSYRDRFHEVDKKSDILDLRLADSKSRHAIFDVCLCVGSVLLGLAPGIWQTPPYGYVLVFSGMILIATSFLAKVSRR